MIPIIFEGGKIMDLAKEILKQSLIKEGCITMLVKQKVD